MPIGIGEPGPRIIARPDGTTVLTGIGECGSKQRTALAPLTMGIKGVAPTRADLASRSATMWKVCLGHSLSVTRVYQIHICDIRYSLRAARPRTVRH